MERENKKRKDSSALNLNRRKAWEQFGKKGQAEGNEVEVIGDTCRR